MLPLLLITAAGLAPAQDAPERGSLRGVVYSEATGTPVGGARVTFSGAGRVEVVADSTGAYRFRSLPPGPARIRASALDHAPHEAEVVILAGRTLVLDLALELHPVQLPPIEVAVEPPDKAVDTVPGGRVELASLTLRSGEAVPGLAELGLAEPVRGSPGNEPVDPTNVLYVRGSAADLKLVLLDGAPVYAPFHVGGLLSPFEDGSIARAALHLGGAPARFDGGLSYIMALESRAPNRMGIRSTGSADLLSGTATFEAGYGDRWGVLAAGRAVHGYGTGWMLRGRLPYDYADGLVRVDAAAGSRLLSVTGFRNQESVQLDGEGPPPGWGNTAGSVRLRGGFPGVDAGEITLAYGRFETRLPVSDAVAATLAGSIDRTRLNLDALRFVGGGALRFGAAYERLGMSYAFRRTDTGEGIGEATVGAGNVVSGYVDASTRLSSSWSVRGGLRADLFGAESWPRLAPRLNVTWQAPGDGPAITLAAGRYHQYVRAPEPDLVPELHGAPTATGSAQATQPLGVARATHLLAGLEQALGYELHLGVEGYYKRFDDVPALGRIGTNASGLDFWVRRFGSESARVGWIGYSLGWTWGMTDERGATDLFAGRHLLSAGLEWPIRRDGRFIGRAAYGAGLPYTAVPSPREQLTRGLGAEGQSGARGSGFRTSTGSSGDVPPLRHSPDDPYLRVDLELHGHWTGRWAGREFRLGPYVKLLNALDRRDALFYEVEPHDRMPRALAALPAMAVLGVNWWF